MNRQKTSAFFDAVQNNDLETAKAIYAATKPGDIHINLKDMCDMTVLHHAAENDNEAMVRFLLDRGANVSDRNDHGRLPSDLCKTPKIKDILKQAFRTKQLIFNLMRGGNFTKLQEVIRNNPASIHVIDTKDDTVLDKALLIQVPQKCTAEQKFELIKFLVESGINVNIKGEIRDLPLHHAIYQRDLDIAALLIKHGADINARVSSCSTPPLFIATQRGDMQAFMFLLANGANPCKPGKYNRNLLHAAAERNQIGMLQFLVENTCLKQDINLPDNYGKTPLHVAATKGMDIAAIRFLLAQPGIRYYPDNEGSTPFHAASNPEIRALLAPFEERYLAEAETRKILAPKWAAHTPKAPR